MEKYIDAEKLLVVLERQNVDKKVIEPLIRIIESLQQEQGLIVINKKDWEEQEQFRKNKDFGKPLQQEQQALDLGADIEMEWNSFNKHLVEYEEGSEEVIWLNWISFIDIACYFYELGLKEK